MKSTRLSWRYIQKSRSLSRNFENRGAASTVAGGYDNTASGIVSTVGGGEFNIASGDYATVAGGSGNTASGLLSTISGGGGLFVNTASGDYSVVGGGKRNLVTDDYGTIGGGYYNQAGDNAGSTTDKIYATVGGGSFNKASGIVSTVAGGELNMASGSGSTVGGGGSNFATGDFSFVGGGVLNLASGVASAVGGGYNNTASGDYSFAAGISANDGGNNRVFVWDDGSGSNATAANTFNVNASGGIYLNGVSIHASDRNKKKDFSFVSAREILDKVVELPIQTWRFKTEEDSISHIGPMAQDFMAAFGYGLDDRYLSTLDMDGVTLAAIQGLYELHREKEAKLELQAEVNTALRWHNAQLHSRNDALEARLARLEKAILRQWEPGASGMD